MKRGYLTPKSPRTFLLALALTALGVSSGLSQDFLKPRATGKPHAQDETRIEKKSPDQTKPQEKILKADEGLDIDRINQIRLQKDRARERVERTRNQVKVDAVGTIRDQVKTRHRLEDPLTRQVPSLDHPFKTRWTKGAKGIRASPSSYRWISGADSIYVLINGLDADSITQGDDFTVTIHFSTGATDAHIEFWVDMNGNGTWEDSVDFEVDEGGHIYDNDDDDEDPSDGVYKITFTGDEDGPNRVSNLGALLVAEDAGGVDAAFLYVKPMATDFSVAGTVTPDSANIIVGAVPHDYFEDIPWMALTDTAGDYRIFLPDSGLYSIFSDDFLGVTDGMFSDTVYHDVFVDSHLTGFDFTYITSTAWIEGIITDENGFPLEDVGVWADMEDGPNTWTETDSAGFYRLGVLEGEWWIGPDGMDLIPEYLVPEAEFLTIAEDETLTVDFVAHETDATIEGTVTIDGEPAVGIGVGAWASGLSWTVTRTEADGSYRLFVASEADTLEGYDVWVWDIPENTVVEEYYSGILSGARNVDFHLHRVFGAIEGIVYDAESYDPIEDAWVSAWDGMMGFGTGTGSDGYYYLPLPNGSYEVDAGADGYYPEFLGNVVISDNVITLDIYLDPLSFDGSLSGHVYEPGSEIAVAEAEVYVESEDYWDYTVTDDSGYYHFPLPNGIYWGAAWKEGYTVDWVDSLVIADDSVTHDFLIEPLVIDAAIEGMVYDAETADAIIGAMIFASSEAFFADAVTGSEGFFHIDVPSDSFWVDVFAEGYHPEFFRIFVAPEDTAWLDVGLMPTRFRPPYIHDIVDVPHDQGRQVRIVWDGGQPGEYGTWTRFSIWRLAGLGPDEPHLWDFIDTVPFHGLEEPYAYVAPTLVDSNVVTGPTGNFYSVFRVTAHTFDPWTFFDSEPMSGYSVDNLAPSVPGGLTVASVDDGNRLTWLPGREEDLDYYTVYRGLTLGFEPGEPYAFTVDTVFLDTDVEPSQTYYYTVTATDFNGNESEYAPQQTVGIRDQEGIQIPNRFELAQNYPNPFNPSTAIRYGLPMRSDVTLIVYDALGRKVRTLVSRSQNAGYYRVKWDGKDDSGNPVASGIYVSRITARSLGEDSGSGDFAQTRKMILLR
ncbi:MAG: carboxypeptidase regulatory-like domain-containing protein [Fidelibacterota bacterium]